MFSSVQFSHSVLSDSLRPHESQHSRPPCPSQTPGVYSNSCPLSRWCHPAISSSVVPFSSCLQSFPASGSFPVSQLFASGGQSFSFSSSPSHVSLITNALTGTSPTSQPLIHPWQRHFPPREQCLDAHLCILASIKLLGGPQYSCTFQPSAFLIVTICFFFF